MSFQENNSIKLPKIHVNKVDFEWAYFNECVKGDIVLFIEYIQKSLLTNVLANFKLLN